MAAGGRTGETKNEPLAGPRGPDGRLGDTRTEMPPPIGGVLRCWREVLNAEPLEMKHHTVQQKLLERKTNKHSQECAKHDGQG